MAPQVGRLTRPLRLTGDQLVDALTGPPGAAPGAGGTEAMVVVDDVPGRATPEALAVAGRQARLLPCVFVGGEGWAEAVRAQLGIVDVVAATAAGTGVLGAPGPEEATAAIIDSVLGAPLAATALAVHLRESDRRSLADGVAAESALYSALQAGPEFAAWRSSRPPRRRHEPHESDEAHEPARPVVAVARDGGRLRITLDRPAKRNALNVQLRDELLDALAIAQADPALLVEIDGRGPDFCSGGDLDEFGTAPDPATAHRIRLDRSIGSAIAAIAERVTVRIHGACVGSGIELPAFAGRVVADRSTTVRLPELGFGLIPGAGGTASLPARIGRHAAAWMAFTRLPVPAEVAARWGLVDEVVVSSERG